MEYSVYRTRWYKFSDYVLLDGIVVPSENSEYIEYDPFLQNNKYLNDPGSNKPIYLSLLKLREEIQKDGEKNIDIFLDFL